MVPLVAGCAAQGALTAAPGVLQSAAPLVEQLGSSGSTLCSAILQADANNLATLRATLNGTPPVPAPPIATAPTPTPTPVTPTPLPPPGSGL